MNRKGFINDILFVFIALFVFFLIIFLVFKMYSEYESSTRNTFTSSASRQVLDQGYTLFLLYDKLFALAILVFSIGLLIASFYVDSNPVFFIVAITALAFLLMFAAAQTSNVYEEISTSGDLAIDVTPRYPIINFIMSNFPSYIAIMGLLSIIIIYAKLKGLVGG